MDQSIIDKYYTICKTNKKTPGSNINEVIYIAPHNIDHLDFELLLEFAVRCILIKKHILSEDENIDISNLVYPNKEFESFKFIDYIIDVYKTCSNKSQYIDIDKAITFWNIYCTIKTLIFTGEKYVCNIEYIPSYLLSAVYEADGLFPTTINGVKYFIYDDFIVYTGFYYLFINCSSYSNRSIDWTNNLSYNISNLLPDAHLYPIKLCIQLLDSVVRVNIKIQYKNIWVSTLRNTINVIKKDIYYPKDHPLSIMTDYTSTSMRKLFTFRFYFNLKQKHLYFIH